MTKPSGVARGDILIAMVSVPTGGTITPHADWNAAEVITGTGDGNVVLKVYIRQAGASEAASWAFTVSPSSIISWGVMAFTGGKGSNIVDVSEALSAIIIWGSPAIDGALLAVAPATQGWLGVQVFAYNPGAFAIAHSWAFDWDEHIDEGETSEVQLLSGSGPFAQSTNPPYPYRLSEPWSLSEPSPDQVVSAIAIFLTAGVAPTITSVTPDHGPISGGETITIIGTGFISSSEVTIGGNACTSIVRTGTTQITCVTPAGTTGAKTLTVYTDEGSVSY
ncbi:MAG: IPT/TIG domain-containing protein [Dehalococcoidia bacterium]